ncbi:MAG: ACR3 family arsenite efflux transporter [Bacillota bacterium]
MTETRNASSATLNTFEKYLSLWVAVCILAGVALGYFFPAVPEILSTWEVGRVSIPVAVLIWMMIFPMMLKVDFDSVRGVAKHPRGLAVTLVTNWIIKPLSMFAVSSLFLHYIFSAWIPSELATQYVAGAILLGAAPCTAMVFVWSHLTEGDPGYTLVQVAVNDLILLVAYAPIVVFLLGVSAIPIPYDTVLASVVLFIVVPLVSAYFVRRHLIRRRGEAWFRGVFLERTGKLTTYGLLATLVLLFSFQGEVILGNTLHILLIAVPLTLQTFFIFFFAYGWAYIWRVQRDVAAPAALIGASNFFELAVAVAISLFGLSSPAALATVVGVLVEVPVMLALVAIANRTAHHFPAKAGGRIMAVVERD